MLYCYKIVRDYGFAPNPFHGYCTLATCKPQIREYCKEEDWIAGFGGVRTAVPDKLVFLMKVNQKMTFDEYWEDEKFANKKPCFDKKVQCCYGDNIYHSDKTTGEWMQENSHHSLQDAINYKNLIHDTRVNKVIISSEYWYFGDEAISLPDRFLTIVPRARGYRKVTDASLITELINYMVECYECGQQGFPFSWNKNNVFERFAGERN